jgi:hypothetical protein
VPIVRAEIEPGGKIVIVMGRSTATPKDDLDRELADFETTHGKA